MLLVKSESTAAQRRIPLYLVDATDGYTAETGLTFSAGELKLSKNGASEANHAGSVTELAGGLYYYEATSGELDTVGFLTLRVAKSGVRAFVALCEVREHVADQVMTRDTSAFEDAAPVKSLGAAVMAAVHKADINDSTGNLDVYESDGVTKKYSRVVTTATGRDPIDSFGGAT